MTSKTASFDVDADPEDVWRVVGENWDEVDRVFPAVADSELVDGSAVEPGAKRRCDLSEPIAGMETVEERLVEWEPPRTFTYEIVDPPTGIRRLGQTWSVEENGTGTSLTLEPFVELRGRPVTLPLEMVVLRLMWRDYKTDVDDLLAAIEQEATKTPAE